MFRLTFECQHAYASGFVLDALFTAGDGVTVLFGPSGAGKSTILNIIAGTLRPQAGVVTVGEQVLLDIARGINLPPEKRRVGCVFQEARLFPHLTVEGNLRYGSRRRPCRSVDYRKVVEVLELGDLLRRYPATLSGGQAQRTALGRAILRGPEVLLMDEPLAGLDRELKDKILTYLERIIAQWQIPTLLVSHDHADVQRLADRVVPLAGGRVLKKGTAAWAPVEAKTSGRPETTGGDTVQAPLP